MKIRLQNERGSALVLVTLLTLILAAIAIIALRNTARGVQQTATFQTRIQAGESAASVTRVASKRVGDQAPKFWRQMTAKLIGRDAENDLGRLGAHGGNTGATLQGRQDAILLGPHVILDKIDLQAMFKGYVGGSTAETGLYSDGTTASFEAQKTSDLRFVIRDPIESNAASGFGLGQAFCFKKVSMYAESTVYVPPPSGPVDAWTGPNNIAQVRGGLEGLIGPIECAN